MIIEYIRYKIAPELQAAFVNSYANAGEALRSSPYCLGYELAQGEEEPENFILRIKWTSTEDHLKGFRSSGQFRAFYKEVAPYFQDIQEMKHYRLTEACWRNEQI